MTTNLEATLEEARAHSDYALMIAALSELARVASDDERKCMYLQEVAEIAERDLADLVLATKAHQQLLELDPSRGTSIGALSRLYATEERWMDLVALKEREAELAPGPAGLAKILGELEVLYRERLGDPQRADEIAAQRADLGAV